MKKLLALVLALVMTLSLCITSNAAFDGEEYDYDEAVEVMAAVGVFQGDENGKFNGKAELTREQAAKLIAYLDLGEKVAEALPAVKVFNDVEATRWSAKYVAYCADAGYLAGVGNGNFDPAGKLTGYAFAKMLLCALGYDAAVEGFTGTNWSIKVAALMQSNDIAKGVSGNASATLTREEAAQYCFNALKATCVKYDNNSVIKVGDVEIKQSTKATSVGTGDVKVYGDEATLQLLEKLYGDDIKYTKSTKDDLGRPAHAWEYKKDKIGTYGDTADYVVVLSKTYDATKFSTNDKIAAELGDLVDNDDLTIDTKTELYLDGTKSNTAAAVAAANKSGTVLELFCDDDYVKRIVVLNYEIAKITAVSTTLTKAQKEDGATCKIQLDDGAYILDTDFAGFVADTYVKGAYVLYIADTNEVLASELAESVEGKVSAMKSGDAKIDGTYYGVVAGKTVKVGDEGTFYLDKAGNVAEFDATNTKSDNYAYIYALKTSDGKNSDGYDSHTVTAYFVKADGTKASAVVNSDYNETDKKYYYDDTETEVAVGVVAYSIDKDDEFNLETAKDTISGPASKTVSKTAAAGTDSETQFIFAQKDGSKMKVTTATGYKNVSFSGKNAYTVTNSDGDIVYVFVTDKNEGVKSDAKLAVLVSAKYVEEENEDGDAIFTYDVVVDGEPDTLTFEKKLANTYVDGCVFDFNMDGDYAELVTSSAVKTAELASATKDYIMVSTNQYNLSDANATYTITLEYEDAVLETDGSFDPDNNTANLDAVTVAEGAKFDAKDKIAYTLDDGKLDVVFVYEYVY